MRTEEKQNSEGEICSLGEVAAQQGKGLRMLSALCLPSSGVKGSKMGGAYLDSTRGKTGILIPFCHF